jgi:glycosyltransferase involved in cell wall biosynthesis
MPPIAVVIPAYRAEKYIAAVLDRIPAFVSAVIVVDDCSPDATADIVRQRSDPRLHLVSHAANQGVGAAVFTGYRKAIELGAEIIVKMDSDDQMDPDYLPSLLDPIAEGRVDITKGNRLRRGYRGDMGPWRLFGNHLLDLLNRIVSGYWHVRDPQNGYVAASSDALKIMDIDSLYKRYAFENDFMIKANIHNLSVMNVDIPARYASEVSGIRYGNFIVTTSGFLLKSYLRRLFLKYIAPTVEPTSWRKEA